MAVSLCDRLGRPAAPPSESRATDEGTASFRQMVPEMERIDSTSQFAHFGEGMQRDVEPFLQKFDKMAPLSLSLPVLFMKIYNK